MSPNLPGPGKGLLPPDARVTSCKQTQQTNEEGKQVQKESETKRYEDKVQVVWRNVIIFLFVHIGSVYGVYLIISGQVMLKTFIFAFLSCNLCGLGITAGAHRLWAHKSYRARWPLRIFLATCQTIAFQNHIFEWVRDHRVHHKFCDTNADPHNSKRGFFFSHMGWLLVRKHRDVLEKGKTIDMSDLEMDWIVMFQKRHFSWLMPLFSFILPTLVPWYFWGENIWVSYWVASILRWVYTLHCAWLVNSAAHMWGDKPFDKSYSATQNLPVGILAIGEGWHNYHHAFPWDYKASELWRINFTTNFLNAMAKIGLAYDLKEASNELINSRIMRTGDNSPPRENPHEGEIWGWDDKDMTDAERKFVSIKSSKSE